MTRNFVGGMLARPQFSAENVWVFDRNPPKNAALHSEYGVQIADSLSGLVRQCSTVVVSVKPQGLSQMLSGIINDLKQHRPLLISLAAGTTIEKLETQIGFDLPIVRIMPNMASRVGLGASGLLANEHAQDNQRAQAQSISDAVGISAWVHNDQDIDSITALSGSGPAYFMLFIQALAQAASKAGIAHQDALRFATQTGLGAAKLIETSDLSIDALIDGICSKGGTTEQAVNQLKNDDLSSVVANAFYAAKRRSEELAQPEKTKPQ